LAHFAARLEGRLPLVGIGGIASAQDALTKIEAGATAVQLYSALVYEGLSLGARIAQDLDAMMTQRGITNVLDLRGAKTKALAAPLD